jgi:hypothetical protein
LVDKLIVNLGNATRTNSESLQGEHNREVEILSARVALESPTPRLLLGRQNPDRPRCKVNVWFALLDHPRSSDDVI